MFMKQFYGDLIWKQTIAINLPNDEKVQLIRHKKTSTENAMKAKFDKILFPISKF